MLNLDLDVRERKGRDRRDKWKGERRI
jgi:hypothetical protein